MNTLNWFEHFESSLHCISHLNINQSTQKYPNRSKILISTESKEEAERLFNGLSAGGEVEGAMGESPWGSYAGMFRDKYGIEWIIEFSTK